jgi:hypothetical protein
MRVIISLLWSLMFLGSVKAGPIYAGNGGHPNPDGSPLSINNGWLITIDEMSGAVTPIGHPFGAARLPGLAFLDGNTLYGSTIGGSSCSPNCPFPGPPDIPNTSRLIQINPDTGALISDRGPITAGVNGPALAISDLSFQPGTGSLFGIEAVDAGLSGNAAGNLYKIDTQTAVATLVGNMGVNNGSIAFAADGTLYLASTDFDSDGNFANMRISTVDPMTALILGSVPTTTFYTSLGYRASDGVLIGGDGDLGNIFAINPTTGGTLFAVANTGLDFVGDLDFRPVPEPSATGLGGLGFLLLILVRLSSTGRPHLDVKSPK